VLNQNTKNMDAARHDMRLHQQQQEAKSGVRPIQTALLLAWHKSVQHEVPQMQAYYST
jgi:hypothetical protein